MKKLIITGVLVGLGVYAYLEYSKKKSKKPCSCSETASDNTDDIRSECEKQVHEQMKTMRFITADMMKNHKTKAISSCMEQKLNT